MPLSLIVRVPASSSAMSLIFQSSPSGLMALSVSDSKRALSMASVALEISSRRKISFRVERVDHQVEDLVDFGLELALAHAHASGTPVGMDCRWAVHKVSTPAPDVKFGGLEKGLQCLEARWPTFQEGHVCTGDVICDAWTDFSSKGANHVQEESPLVAIGGLSRAAPRRPWR